MPRRRAARDRLPSARCSASRMRVFSSEKEGSALGRLRQPLAAFDGAGMH